MDSAQGHERKNQQPLLIINAHYDHRGKQARIESSKVIVKHLKAVSLNSQIIVLGDFNTKPFGPAYNTLIKGFNLKDPLADLNSKKDFTFHGFSGIPRGNRIDWILHSPSLKSLKSTIIRSNKNGRYPSDHFPVSSELIYVYKK